MISVCLNVDDSPCLLSLSLPNIMCGNVTNMQPPYQSPQDLCMPSFQSTVPSPSGNAYYTSEIDSHHTFFARNDCLRSRPFLGLASSPASSSSSSEELESLSVLS